jgi:hypothetical protein
MTIKELTEQNLREAVKRNTEKAAGHVTVADNSKLRNPHKSPSRLADAYKGKKRSIRDYIDLRKYE